MALVDLLQSNHAFLVVVTVALGLMVGSFLNVVIHRLPVMMGLAALFASLSGLIGLYLSYYLSIASGAAIVLMATAFFLVVFLIKRLG